MSICLGCDAGSRDDPMPDFLCPECREALEVGRLVMAMPDDSLLHKHCSGTWNFNASSENPKKWVGGETALEALRKAVGE